MKLKTTFVTLFLLLTISLSATTAVDRGRVIMDVTDSLLNGYLADTLNAAQKIKELNLKARKLDDAGINKSESVRTYQTATRLVPYAKDSFAVIARLYADFSSALSTSGSRSLAIQYGIGAFNYYKKAYPAASSTSYNMLGKIAGFYFGAEQYDSAERYFRLAAVEAKDAKIPLWIASANNNLGVLFFKQGRFTEAAAYYKTAASTLQIHNRADSVLQGSITDNLAEIALVENDLNEAVRLYTLNEKWYQSLKSYPDIVKSDLGLGRVYLSQKSYGKLWTQLAAARSLVFGPYNIGGKYFLAYYQLLKQYSIATGNLASALNAENSIEHYKDSLAKTNNEALNHLTDALVRSDIATFNNEIELYRAGGLLRDRELQHAQLTARKNLAFFILTLLLAAVIMFLLFAFYRNKNKAQKEHIELQRSQIKLQHDEIEIQRIARELSETKVSLQQMEQERLEEELHYRKKDISNLALYLSKLKDINDTMMDRLEDLKNKKPTEQKEALTNVVNELSVVIQSQEKATIIQENIDLVNTQFAAKIVQMFPELTKSEIELCGLFKMNLSNKEISLLKNISPMSVKMARYRLRKKLGLPPEGDIYRFLADL